MIATMSKLSKPARRPTYADIEALPPGVNGEILAGELVASPRPAGTHIRSASVLGALLLTHFDAALTHLLQCISRTAFVAGTCTARETAWHQDLGCASIRVEPRFCC